MAPITSPIASTVDFAASLEAKKEAIAALPDDQVRAVRHDIPTIASVVIGSLPELDTLRAAILAQAGPGYLAILGGIEKTVEAMQEAHVRFLMVEKSPSFSDLSERALALREMLYFDARSAVARGKMPAAAIANLRGNVGHKNQAQDLLMLANAHHDHRAALLGATAVTEADIIEAKELAARLIKEPGEREQSPSASPSAELRTRAYSLVLAEWDELRRAVRFVRWHEGDWEQYAPSLWSGRGRRAGEEPTNEPTPIEPEEPNTPTPDLDPNGPFVS